jgi:hypothetical protein
MVITDPAAGDGLLVNGVGAAELVMTLGSGWMQVELTQKEEQSAFVVHCGFELPEHPEQTKTGS